MMDWSRLFFHPPVFWARFSYVMSIDLSNLLLVNYFWGLSYTQMSYIYMVLESSPFPFEILWVIMVSVLYFEFPFHISGWLSLFIYENPIYSHSILSDIVSIWCSNFTLWLIFVWFEFNYTLYLVSAESWRNG